MNTVSRLMLMFSEIVYIRQEKAKAELVVPGAGQFPDLRDCSSPLHADTRTRCSESNMIEFGLKFRSQNKEALSFSFSKNF